ncbi:uncharacterized protein [Eleutherodactylus coqui]|uniref:uncharacterized protein n=1 Tax=Eleutherodactylus coqui TaxID=57060 RepID=UPI0034617CEA
MMDYGRKTFIFLTLCALVGANEAQPLVTILEIFISIPSTHIGDTEIVSAVLNTTADHPFRYTVVAQKNQTKCINSTDPLCLSLIQPPALDVSVSISASNGKNVTYSAFINGSLALAVHVGPEVSVRPQMLSGGSDAITFLLDITYNKDNTTRHLFGSRRRQHTGFGNGIGFGNGNGFGNGYGNSYSNSYGNSYGIGFGVSFVQTRRTTVVNDGTGTGYWNGEPALRSAPLCALILLALLPVLLLK